MKRIAYYIGMIGLLLFCLLAPWLMFGCTSANIDRARAIYETVEEYREAERRELEEKQQAERDALEAAQRAEAERLAQEQAEYDRRYQAALPGPHPAQRRAGTMEAWTAYWDAGKKPNVLRPEDAGYDLLWKTPDHALRATVLLFGRARMPIYKRGKMRVVIAADPEGKRIIAEPSIQKPWGAHPAARLPELGQHYRPGSVFVVLFDGNTRAAVYHLPDPGIRTGALRWT